VYDHYRSVRDLTLMIFVDKDAVPPFRYKVGGWDLFQTSVDLGPAMRARIAKKGYFLLRATEDASETTKLKDIPSRLPPGQEIGDANDVEGWISG
jgi:hypothetical protein